MRPTLNIILIISLISSIFIGGFYYLSEVLQPFIFGAVMAYFLDPLTDKLVKYKIPRVLAASFLIIISLVILSIVLLFIFPIFAKQFWNLLQILPSFYDWFLNFARVWWEGFFGEKLEFTDSMQSIRSGVQENLSSVIGGVFVSSMVLVKFLTNTIITIFIAFYLLLDWDRLVLFVGKLIPPRYQKLTHTLFSDIDRVLARFFRGQMIVCSILALYYGISLMLVGIDTGLALGLFAGLISFIPFVGAILGGGLTILITLLQFWENPTIILIVFTIFVVGQLLESNFLTPNLVGKSVGIHPVWLIFSLALFGSLGGFVGLLFAVPVAAIFGVLIRHYLAKYFSSDFYSSKGL